MLLHETPSPPHSPFHERRTRPFSRYNSPSPVAPDMSLTAQMSSSYNRRAPEQLASPSSVLGHGRQQSFSPVPYHLKTGHQRQSSTTTFAQQFITKEIKTEEKVSSIDGENDFSGKRYVWVKDSEKAFIRGWIVDNSASDRVVVQFDDGSQLHLNPDEIDQVNPAKFDKADDMAELTHLNEASVIHNLQTRYQADLIYTYSGLFLVTINPYCPLPIYGNDYIRMHKGQAREDTKPHIFAVSDAAFRRLVEEGENQSILVTGESGAGKTENTKKVIQYLAAVATTDSEMIAQSRTSVKQISNLSQQILRANPILESFGNAQTVRNNNSSRFGKFIRIQFTRSGQIAGAFIDWYLLEKSRVVKVGSQERSYHVFYQLLAGADAHMRDSLLLSGLDVDSFEYLRAGNDIIGGVSDKDEWNALIEAFHVMDFSEKDRLAIFKTISAILHLGNVTVVRESRSADQATLTQEAKTSIGKACQLLSVQAEPFIQGLLHPKVKAGREWVEKVQTPEQVRLALDALSKGIYERGFGDLVSKINARLDRGSLSSDDNRFIGVLDIAGFEIFETNSFEQLCINYTNEKLQQFFNHYMFVLEQEEYAREQIEWQFIDFGKDLQPTIDLIELPNPIGIFSCLDEDSVMPKATDQSFTDKLHSLWEKKTPKYTPARPRPGFILTHYAADVEYNTEGWLEKNKDPLNDNLTRLLASSKDDHVANLFSDCVDEADELYSPRSRVKKGLFRTVAQRHKEQLSSLMRQLHSTQPHFVRCILPNHKKKPKQFNAPLVLDQLRCNGVLEGIRIARTGFPNRLTFAEFRSRYEVLCHNMPKGYLAGQEAAKIMLDRLELDNATYRVGLTKVFFRAGVLAELEEQRDSLIREIMSRFQSLSRGFMQRRVAFKQLYRTEATRVIQHNMNVYLDLQANPWWRLFVRMRPLLGETRTANEVKRRDERIEVLQTKLKEDQRDRQKVEEDRRRAELEIARVQQTLESERALALDKEEIFRRLQDRESELTEKLSEAIQEQDALEDQLDSAIQSRKETEEELATRREQVVQAGQIITRLETEKKELQSHVERLDKQLVAITQSSSRNDDKVETLDQEVQSLQSQLGLKERKILQLEKGIHQAEREREQRTSSLESELRALKSQLASKDRVASELEAKLTSIQKAYAAEQDRKTFSYEQETRSLKSQLTARDRRLADLESQFQHSSQKEQELESRFSTSLKELNSARKSAQDLQSDNETLHRKIDQLSSVHNAHESALREKDTEVSSLQNRLKTLVAQCENLSNENGRMASKHADIAIKQREVEEELETMKTRRKKMELEALEVRKRLEGSLSFFSNHF